MRTRNADNPKSGAKKTPPKKGLAASASESADKTPETAKPTPKSAKATKVSARQSTPQAASITPSETKAEEAAATTSTPVPAAKPVVKKTGVKAKTPPAARGPGRKPKAAPKVEQVQVEKVQEADELPLKKEEEPKMKEEPETNELEIKAETEVMEEPVTNTGQVEEENKTDMKELEIKAETEVKEEPVTNTGQVEEENKVDTGDVKVSTADESNPDEEIKMDAEDLKIDEATQEVVEPKEDTAEEEAAQEEVEPKEQQLVVVMEEDSVENPEAKAEDTRVEDEAGVEGEAKLQEDEVVVPEAAAEEELMEVREEEDTEGGGGVMEEEQMQMSAIANERKKKKELEIFVGGLERNAMEEDVKKAFEKVGDVVEVRLHKDLATNKNKGFAFVKFANKEQVDKALVELKNPIICGKRCGIARSEDNDTLFLGNICNTWTKDAIKRKLKDYGVDSVESITLVEDSQNEGLSRGFAFLEFSCHAEAMLAYKRLQKPDAVFGHPQRTVKVAFAEPLREPDAEVMSQVKSVFIDGLPPYWDEDRVKEQFKNFGEIERVVLARNMATAKRKDFGFVNFTTHEDALAFIEAVNNTELGDGKMKMKARARLANPLPKTQAVKGGMRGGFRIGRPNMGMYPRFGKGFGRGRFPSNRAGFVGGRGFYPRGRGRAGRFPFANDNNPTFSQAGFRGGRPFGGRDHFHTANVSKDSGLHAGGRRGSFRNVYDGSAPEFFPRGVGTSMLDMDGPQGGAFERGRGRPFSLMRNPVQHEADFGMPFGSGPTFEDPYYYSDSLRGIKRPFSMVDHDPGYMEPVSRLRPRYEHPDPLLNGSRYGDPLGTAGSVYLRDNYGPEYDGGAYSSLYGGEPSGSGYYY
ncbi:Polyadenylate-binding protein RBP47B [Acorus gramineus]|uniref:Polyadenylate-binding protein RBP47B n=1 Tax=Acorus gramineus TaxID=55184 RepID=A0AAV9BAG2_ACOGR|nr:Polyadenylate-binding protein RBP47B [Acorus gramineus]